MGCLVWKMSCGFVRMFPSLSFIHSIITWLVALNVFCV